MEKCNASKKIQALLFLIGGFLIIAFIAEMIYFISFYSHLTNRAMKLFLNIGWLYLWGFSYYKLTIRYTHWWNALEGKQNK